MRPSLWPLRDSGFAASRRVMDPDDRSSLAQAMAWSSTIIAIALEMVLPAFLGLWVDRLLGTKFVFLLLGAAAGLVAGMVHLIRVAKSAGRNSWEEIRPPRTDEKR